MTRYGANYTQYPGLFPLYGKFKRPRMLDVTRVKNPGRDSIVMKFEQLMSKANLSAGEATMKHVSKVTTSASMAILAVLAGFSISSEARAGPLSCDTRVNNTQNKLQECVTLEAVRAHQAALQAVADANDGNRAAGTPGYDASVDYVAATLESAGYHVELDPFDFTFVPPATLIQTAPFVEEYETGAFSGSGFGEVSGPVIPVDLALGASP